MLRFFAVMIALLAMCSTSFAGWRCCGSRQSARFVTSPAPAPQSVVYVLQGNQLFPQPQAAFTPSPQPSAYLPAQFISGCPNGQCPLPQRR